MKTVLHSENEKKRGREREKRREKQEYLAPLACCAQHALFLAPHFFLTAWRINSDTSDIFPRRRTLRISRLTVLYRRRNGAKEAALAKCVVERLEGRNLCVRKVLAYAQVLIT